MLLDKDIKQNSKKIRNLIKKEIKKPIPKISEAKFDVWKIITKSLSQEIDTDYFTVGNNAWGNNRLKITKHFYEKFFKDFKKGSFEKMGQSKKFKENIYNLLNLSVNKTPQKSDKDRTFPFKQQTKYGQEYAIPGKETYYSDKKNSDNYYHYSYCNKTKIKFFKGPSDQEKIIIKNKWQNLFSECFIYGYLLSSVKLICDLGSFDTKKEKPSDPLSDIVSKYKKNPFSNVIYNKAYIKSLITNYYEKFYNVKHNESVKIFEKIENSVFKSKLSHFLLLKNENYFIYRFKKFLSDEYDGTGDFISSIEDKKDKYLANSKDKRFIDVIKNTRKDLRIKKIRPNTLGPGDGCILNFEQFRFYTLSLHYLNPYTESQLGIEEKDIFIRYAVNLGVQEILFYVMEQIFSPTYN